jgi:hypothetical protein
MMPEVEINTNVTREDIDAAQVLGATGTEVLEFAIHRCLDEQGVPRQGRDVTVTMVSITIDMPAGWSIKQD